VSLAFCDFKLHGSQCRVSNWTAAVGLGLGGIVALYYRLSTVHQIH
jgi:hypothetical protein